jgi:hypothetical protein
MSHSVTLTWNASTDMPSPIPTGSGYNVYRNTVAGTTGAVLLNTSPIAADTYVDNTVVPGTYFYYVVTVLDGVDSVNSTEISAVVLPAAVTNLAAVVV